MGRYEREGVCLAVWDEEQDHLRWLDGAEAGDESISQVVKRAAGTTAEQDANSAELDSFELVIKYVDDEYSLGVAKAYRERSGRQFPPVYRVKITVEAEAMPDEEAEAFWNALAESREHAVREGHAEQSDAPAPPQR